MSKLFKKVQLKTDDGLVFNGDLIEMNSSNIIINNITFTIEGKNSNIYKYIDKLNLSRQASFDRNKILWLNQEQ